MNNWNGIGRLARDPEVRYTQGENPMCVARFTLAIDNYRKNGSKTSWIPCVAIGKNGQFAEKYLKKGSKVALTGEIVTDDYTDKSGKKVYTWNVTVEKIEFAESKNSGSSTDEQPKTDANGFMNIPDGIDEELPFN